MNPMRIVAIPTELAKSVRAKLRDPKYGHRAHVEMAAEGAPCRHCLKLIRAGVEKSILFTLDRFAGVETLPLPGPVYIHARECQRYSENGGIPEELRKSPRTLEAYAKGRRLLAQEYVTNGEMEQVAQRLFERPEVDYINVCSTTAGCFTFRIERADDNQRRG
jgi:hypothetical protein